MKRLDDLTLGERIVVAIGVFLACVIALWLLSYLVAQAENAPDLYQGVPLDAKHLELDKRALDEAYHAQVLFLFGVWLKGGEADDGRRFANGMRILRRAHTIAAQTIEKREQQLQNKPGQK